MLVEQCAYVAMTTKDLARARSFWVDRLECAVVQEEVGRHFVVGLGTLRVRVEVADGALRRSGSTDPILAFKVTSLPTTLAKLAEHDIHPLRGVLATSSGPYAELQDPDGRTILLAENL